MSVFQGCIICSLRSMRGIRFVAEVGRGGEYDATAALNSIVWRSCVTVYKLRDLALLYRIIITVLGVPSLTQPRHHPPMALDFPTPSVRGDLTEAAE